MNPGLGRGRHGISFCFKSSLSNAVMFILLAYHNLCNKMYLLPGNTTDIQVNVSRLVKQLFNQYGTSSNKY